jgi:hypothetical protein
MEKAVEQWNLTDHSKPRGVFDGYSRTEAAQTILNQAAEFVGTFIAKLQNTVAEFDLENHVMFWTGIRPGSKECNEVRVALRNQTNNDWTTRDMLQAAAETHVQPTPPDSKSNIGSPGI